MTDSALNLVDRGQGDLSIVLIHGFTCELSNWKAQLSGLSGSHRCVAIDLPGHGASPESGEASIEALAAAVNDTLHQLGLEEVVLVGHSMGCRVISEMTIQAPDLVRGLVYVDGSRVSSDDVEASVSRARETLDALGMEGFLETLYAGFFVDATPAVVREDLLSALSQVYYLIARIYVINCMPKLLILGPVKTLRPKTSDADLEDGNSGSQKEEQCCQI